MTEGNIHDLHTGERVGETPDIETAFLTAVRHAATIEEVYVVTGPDAPEGFQERVEEVCPVVIDPAVTDGAMILAGTPDEWEPLTPDQMEALTALFPKGLL